MIKKVLISVIATYVSAVCLLEIVIITLECAGLFSSIKESTINLLKIISFNSL